MQIVHVEMDDVKFFGALHYVFEHYVVMSELIDAAFVQAQRTWTTGYETRGRLESHRWRTVYFVPIELILRLI